MTNDEARGVLNELTDNLSCYGCPYSDDIEVACANGCLINRAIQTIVDATVKPEDAEWEVDEDAKEHHFMHRYFSHTRICSNCKFRGRVEYRFCPNCGAKMRWVITL